MQKKETPINLFDLLNTLIKGKILIISITFFVTVFTALNVHNKSAVYEAYAMFLSPNEESVSEINTLNFMSETKNTILDKFLSLIDSQTFKIQAFNEGNFIEKFDLSEIPANSIQYQEFINGFISSVSVKSPSDNMSASELEFLLPKFSVTMVGNNERVMLEYLQYLIYKANTKIVNQLINVSKLKTEIRLKEITERIEYLKVLATIKRLSLIARIQEEDFQKIKDINHKIDSVRSAANTMRLNEIAVLTEALDLAKGMGIKDNNLQQIISRFVVSNDEENNLVELPDWYLYGEIALKNKIELLSSRKNNDNFVPKLVKLNSDLYLAQNNNALEALLSRVDDGPFIPQLPDLTAEEKQLKGNLFDDVEIELVRQTQVFSKQVNKNYKKNITTLAFLMSLIISILLVLIMSSLKKIKNSAA